MPKWCEHAILESEHIEMERAAQNWRAIVECAKREGNARKPGRMDLIADDDMIDIILDVIRGHFRRVEEVEKLRSEVKQLKLRLEGLEK